MKILIIEPCGFTRLGIHSFLFNNNQIEILDFVSIADAIPHMTQFSPELVLINITQLCQNSKFSTEIKTFLDLLQDTAMFCYLDSQYPVTNHPVHITNDVYILNKQLVTTLLKTIAEGSTYYPPYNTRCIFSEQEILVMNYWMSEMPNHKIARKLEISNRTVYVHKRHLAQKIKVRNRLEFCFVYNFIKYLFWPINESARAPISRQIKDEILTLYKQ
ncbi:LuxR C-terminal-related transcriptional regulator [Ewingella sp. AOP8-B2-18]|nr:response regulator transcription factor [Pseudomonas reactans]